MPTPLRENVLVIFCKGLAVQEVTDGRRGGEIEACQDILGAGSSKRSSCDFCPWTEARNVSSSVLAGG